MIFVFGSNLAGRHGKGAALHAARHHEAQAGVGEGLTGRSYAIPTKDERLRVRAWPDVCASVDRFLKFAATHGQRETFLLTPIGCGLAGYSAADMWRFIQSCGVPNNVVFSAHWANDHMIQGEGE
jgi:hypothetical protein